jgi:hypothetical protein
MGGYVTLPAAWRSNREAVDLWVGKSLATVATLPPKKKR